MLTQLVVRFRDWIEVIGVFSVSFAEVEGAQFESRRAETLELSPQRCDDAILFLRTDNMIMRQ